MPRAARIPEPNELLCESCGYTLTGLVPAGHCPECGHLIADSLPEHRHPAAWEMGQGVRSIGAFVRTAGGALFRPNRFFRSLAVRREALPAPADYRAFIFGLLVRLLAVCLIAVTGTAHLLAIGGYRGTRFDVIGRLWLLWFVVAVVATAGVTHLVARLTAWEAAYRGLRLPYPVVSRALQYHAVHLLVPTSAIALVSVGYAVFVARDVLQAVNFVEPYIYTLAALVVIGSLYLFRTYWTAMRNLMYAN